jgi:hypothetical protein
MDLNQRAAAAISALLDFIVMNFPICSPDDHYVRSEAPI